MAYEVKTRIQYIAVDGTKWQAEMNKLSRSLMPETWEDPSFKHFNERGQHTHNDDKIGYISGDGLTWYAKCHSHSHDGTNSITFNFEHFRWGNGSPNHESDTIEFRGWDGGIYKLSLPERYQRDPYPLELYFHVERVR